MKIIKQEQKLQAAVNQLAKRKFSKEKNFLYYCITELLIE